MIGHRLVVCGSLSLFLLTADPCTLASPSGDASRVQEDGDLLSLLEASEQKERALDLGRALDDVYPLTPEEIDRVRKAREAYERAMAPRPATMRTQTRSVPIPPTTHYALRLTEGYSSTVLFQDQLGNPWPVAHTVVGNPGAFSLINGPEKEGETHSHMLNLVPLKERASSNLAVSLVHCPYPILLHLTTTSPLDEKREADALLILRINGRGPLSPQKPAEKEPESLSDTVLGFLHGIADAEAKTRVLTPEQPETTLWELNDTLYLRTPHPLVWPAWKEVARGEGIHVYVLPKTRSIVLSVNGKSRTVHIAEEAYAGHP
ncbi:MAG: hypothetical protein IJU76_13130 [Desulfovibrionaceae bacterium]|nr:hypothetical protein [Desulfovibrionaceae bacterium]